MYAMWTAFAAVILIAVIAGAGLDRAGFSSADRTRSADTRLD